MAPFAVAFNLAVCLFFLASASASAVIARSADELAGLLRRQTSISYGDIPAGCQSSCSSMVSTINVSCFLLFILVLLLHVIGRELVRIVCLLLV
ncbi:hypothetical protein ONZ45_g1186 [Pleurotus djamor]|nr:hypothetical protein ONZ45_g1186 [Pleurotus djamor]